MGKPDFAYKFGCGRYLQGEHVLEKCGEEVLRLHCRHPLIVGGPHAFAAALGRVTASLEEKSIPFYAWEYTGWCCPSFAERLCAYAKEHGHDLIVGIGGGRIMDLAKAAAALADLPVMNVPTSAATCAAFTPLSVMYTEEGKTIPSSTKHKNEVNAVLADLDVLLTEPPRLLIAGAYDAMAKYIELTQRTKGKRPEEMALGLDYSYLLARQTYTQLRELLPAALEALKTGVANDAFSRVIYINIAVTGVISGIAKGSSQTALAHEFYELARTLFTAQAKDFVHGELVGMGLAVQLDYNGDADAIPDTVALLKEYSLPVYLPDIGVEASEENIEKLWREICLSDTMDDTTDADRARLLAALHRLVPPKM